MQEVDGRAETRVSHVPLPHHMKAYGSLLSLAPSKEKLPIKLGLVTTDPPRSGKGGNWSSNQIAEVVPGVQ